jgi:hypothetical protein
MPTVHSSGDRPIAFLLLGGRGVSHLFLNGHQDRTGTQTLEGFSLVLACKVVQRRLLCWAVLRQSKKQRSEAVGCWHQAGGAQWPSPPRAPGMASPTTLAASSPTDVFPALLIQSKCLPLPLVPAGFRVHAPRGPTRSPNPILPAPACEPHQF